MGTTTRLALPFPARPDTADVPRDVEALAEASDAVMVAGYSGPFSSRPAAGKRYRLWIATDKSPGDPDYLTMDDGTSWVTINFTISIPDRSLGGIKLILNTVTQNEMGANSIGPPQLINGAVVAAKLANGAVGYVAIADALKPSTGVADGDETLRALGTGTGEAAKGIHALAHLKSGGDPLVQLFLDAGSALPTPAPANESTYFFLRTVNGGTLYRGTGTAWEQIAAPLQSPGKVLAKAVRATDIPDPGPNVTMDLLVLPSFISDGKEVKIEMQSQDQNQFWWALHFQYSLNGGTWITFAGDTRQLFGRDHIIYHTPPAGSIVYKLVGLSGASAHGAYQIAGAKNLEIRALKSEQ